jgi:HEPN domain-containing protein
MKKATRAWVAKAEKDFISAQRERRARKSPNYDDCCFHCQQCAEKYFKALLQERAIPFSKTHNLPTLAILLPVDPILNKMQPGLSVLSTFAVDYRYPGLDADKPTAANALKLCRQVRSYARKALGLPVK